MTTKELNRTIENLPTLEQYEKYQAAFDYFNQELFEGQLSPCLLTFSRKSKRIGGYFIRDKWQSGDRTVHEIALNPSMFSGPLIEMFAALVHEQIHQWQCDYGKPKKGGYHDKEFADKSESLGLIPSDTGQPGGKRTGSKMSHYIEENGPFWKAFEAMPADIKLPWVSGEIATETKEKDSPKKEKQKYECPKCGGKAWGKPDLNLFCGCQNPPVLMNPNTLKQHPTPNPLKALAEAVQLLRQQGQTDEEIVQGLKETPIFDCLDELKPLRPVIKEWLKTEAPRQAVTVRKITVGKPPEGHDFF